MPLCPDQRAWLQQRRISMRDGLGVDRRFRLGWWYWILRIPESIEIGDPP